MSKEIIYRLLYQEKGEQKAEDFRIYFVPNIRHHQYEEIFEVVNDVQDKFEQIKKLESDALKLIEKNSEDKKIDEKRKTIIELSNEIKKYKKSSFFDKRVKLITGLLVDNGIKDEKFLSEKFWNECVEPVDMMDFISSAIFKDIDKKKVQ